MQVWYIVVNNALVWENEGENWCLVGVFLTWVESCLHVVEGKKLEASMARYRPLFPFNLILGYVSVVWTVYVWTSSFIVNSTCILSVMLILWYLQVLGWDSVYMLMWWEVHCGQSSVQMVVIGDACSCAAGYHENFVPFKFCWSPSHRPKTNPLPAGCKLFCLCTVSLIIIWTFEIH